MTLRLRFELVWRVSPRQTASTRANLPRGGRGTRHRAPTNSWPQLAEHAEGHHRPAFDCAVKIAQHKRRSTEPAELLAQRFFA